MTPEQAGRLSVLAAAVLCGTSGTAQALGPAQASPVAVGFGRLLLGAAVLTAIAGHREAGSLRQVLQVGRVPALCAAVATAVYQAAMAYLVRPSQRRWSAATQRDPSVACPASSHHPPLVRPRPGHPPRSA